MTKGNLFRRFAAFVSRLTGTSYAFAGAILIIIVWGFSGRVFSFSDTWQLVINTGTTIVTFLMVFLIQNTQNRDSKAIHLKLDELLKGVKGARSYMSNVDELSDKEIDELHEEFKRINERYVKALVKRGRSKEEVQKSLLTQITSIFNPLK